MSSNIIALDVGKKRIGVAVANMIARLPQPLTTLTHTPAIYTTIKRLANEQQAGIIVVGLPRGLDGQTTAQTRDILAFVDKLKQHVSLPVYTQDEALTSVKAEAELASRKRTARAAEIDALAATYILEDFLQRKEVLV